MVSVRGAAGQVGTDRASGLVVAAGLAWPPDPPVGLRDLLSRLAGPETPTSLALGWDVDVAGKIIRHPPSDQGVPLGRWVTFLWDDAGAGTPHAATGYVVSLASPAGPVPGSPFSVGTPGGFGFSFSPADDYTWSVAAVNALGTSPATAASTFQVVDAPAPTPPPPPPTPAPPPPPPPPTATASVTLQVGLSLPANIQSITTAGFQLSGPGAPTTPVGATRSSDLRSATAVVPLPAPATGGSASYALTGTCAFHYDQLTGPSGVTGPEDAEAMLAAPVPISWHGKALEVLLGVRYNGFTNAFEMSVDTILGG